MPRLAVCLAALAGALALAAAGCGGEGGGGGPTDGAGMTPATAALFVALNTDFDGDQWRTAADLVDRFPGGDGAVDRLRERLVSEGLDFEQDVKPALGPEVDVVALSFEDLDSTRFIGLTQPRDREKFEQLAERSDEDFVYEFVDDWAVFADSQDVIDRFLEARDGDALGDAEAFEQTTGALPEEALATVYVNGEELTELLEASGTPEEDRAALACGLGEGGVPSMAFSLGAEDDGARLSGALRAENLAVPDEGGSELAGEVEAGALLFVSLRGLGEQLRETFRCLRDADEKFNEDLAQAELFLDVSVEEDILPLFEGETAIVVYPPSEVAQAQDAELPIAVPTAALVTQVEDEAQALETADRLAERAASFVDGVELERVTIGGVEARRVETGRPVDVYYAAFDRKLVVATSEDGIAAVQGDRSSLTDDADYAAAREAAGPPDETTGFWYADVADGIEYFLDLYSSAAGEEPPAEVVENLEPLRSLFLWSETDGDIYSFDGLLEIE